MVSVVIVFHHFDVAVRLDNCAGSNFPLSPIRIIGISGGGANTNKITHIVLSEIKCP